jgi:membrane protease YdiL (CAAX protease family)
VTTKREIVIYTSIVFMLAIMVSLGRASAELANPTTVLILGMSTMLIPAISAGIMAIGFRAPVGKLDFSLPFNWTMIALFLIPVSTHLVTIPLTLLLNDGIIPWKSFPLQFILGQAILGIMLISFGAFFEEIGWRAWLLPRLMQLMSTKNAILTGAAIWALWHIAYVLSGITSVEGMTRYQTLLVPVGTFGAGLIINWTWVNTKSIVVVSLAHGALNNWGQLALRYIDDDAHALELLAGVDVALIVSGIVVVFFIKNKQINP